MFLSEQMFEGNFYVVLRGLFSCAIPLTTEKFDNLLVCDDKKCSSFYTGSKICKKTGPSTSKPFGCCCIKRWASIHY